nr:hypothetical protein [Tanacetum cinerariifolium]
DLSRPQVVVLGGQNGQRVVQLAVGVQAAQFLLGVLNQQRLGEHVRALQHVGEREKHGRSHAVAVAHSRAAERVLHQRLAGPRHQRVHGVGFGRLPVDGREGDEQVGLLKQHQPLKEMLVHLALEVGLLGLVFAVGPVVVDVGFLHDGAGRQRPTASKAAVFGFFMRGGNRPHRDAAGLDESEGEPAHQKARRTGLAQVAQPQQQGQLGQDDDQVHQPGNSDGHAQKAE